MAHAPSMVTLFISMGVTGLSSLVRAFEIWTRTPKPPVTLPKRRCLASLARREPIDEAVGPRRWRSTARKHRDKRVSKIWQASLKKNNQSWEAAQHRTRRGKKHFPALAATRAFRK